MCPTFVRSTLVKRVTADRFPNYVTGSVTEFVTFVGIFQVFLTSFYRDLISLLSTQFVWLLNYKRFQLQSVFFEEHLTT
jgi:hypothetical protein